MLTLWQDVRYALRLLAKNPGFAFVAVLTLALGIGANTAIFTVVNGALLRPLPYSQPERLVHLWETRTQQNASEFEASYPNFVDWKAQNHVFDDIAGFSMTDGILTQQATMAHVRGARVTSNFFSVLGVTPQLGRTFLPEEEPRSAERVILLSHSFWQQRFGSDTWIIGKKITLNDNPWTVVGVLSPRFQFALVGSPDFWVPLRANDSTGLRRNLFWLHPVARLKSGVSFAQASQEMESIAQRLATAYPEANAGGGIRLVPLKEEILGKVSPVIFVLLGAVALVLLIACVNVANLLLARAATREREIAVRAALGAGRGRLIRQLLAESLLLALLGGAAGVLWAMWGVDLLISLVPADMMYFMPYLSEMHLDAGVLVFTAMLSLLTGVLFGLAPALRASKAALYESLKEGSRTNVGPAGHRVRGALVVSQVAFALILLAGTGLVLQSMFRLLSVDPGFATKNLLSAAISLPGKKYQQDAQGIAFYQQLRQRVAALPGVSAVGTANIIPLTGGGNTIRYIDGRKPNTPPDQELEAYIRAVSPSYFRAMGIPFLGGRDFEDTDRDGAPRVVIINDGVAKRLFPGEDAVGKDIVFTFNHRPLRVVGVVGNAELASLDAESMPAIYESEFQGFESDNNLVVRTGGDPAPVVAAIRQVVRTLDPEALVLTVQTMQQTMVAAPSIFLRRSLTFLLSAFAAVAVLLAAIGLYGVMNYNVTHRTREIGLRVALGAQRADVMRLILRQGMTLVATGVAIGIAGAAGVTQLMQSVLFGTKAADPVTIAVVAVVLSTVALAACWIPARRATRVDPMVALRYE